MKNKLLIFTIVILGIIIVSATIYFQQNLSQKDNIPEGEGFYGILTVVTDCMIPEGCGPKYKFWDSEMKSYTPLLGDIRESHSGLVIQVVGEEITLPSSEYNDMNYRGPTNAIDVKSYNVLSKIPYHEFLVKKAGETTPEKCPRAVAWNKGFSWEIQDDKTILKVRMTNTFSDDEPQPFYELWYDGNSGEFIKEIKQPADKNFCEN
jgi:hypothetical protein|tara:strand:+ start:3195 stop:3812 length:618 start_codon:yes stop_codon:yes gene_type:complete